MRPRETGVCHVLFRGRLPSKKKKFLGFFLHEFYFIAFRFFVRRIHATNFFSAFHDEILLIQSIRDIIITGRLRTTFINHSPEMGTVARAWSILIFYVCTKYICI